MSTETKFVNALEALARFYADARECSFSEIVMRRTEACHGDMSQVERLVLPLVDSETIGPKLPGPLRELMLTGPGEL